MGVYGSSAPLDSRDIDADSDDEEQYFFCSNCDEEYCEEELTTFIENRTYQENVCENCIRAYREKLQELIDQAIEQVDELWKDLYINR